MKKLLIANRGEIARRIIRTAHRMGITTVAAYSEADAPALHVREATTAVALGGNTSTDTYLRIDKLLAAARATGADAVHPGYGFLSENAEFAQAVIDAGLTWVGPPPDAIRALGNKASAKQLALARNVPCLPGYQGTDQTDERFVQEAARVGYPVMVKATAGGGGRGMRLVTAPELLLAALQSARSEALSGFGSDELLIERALLNPRHVEVQVFADQHGHCIHLGERDCSVQRRHQKIIEESPSPAVNAELRTRMGASAVELALTAGYVGAGTVEFLLEGDSFFLMEMNTRLQVEHPVTEMLTGLDLVEWQLRIADGEPLPLTQAQVAFKGHAIEVRLCAEDDNYTPHAGTVQTFTPPAPGEGIRADHALESGAQVPPFYDSMIGKIIVHADTRDQAIDKLLDALGTTQVLGLPSNRSFLRATLDHPQFRAGQALIPFLAHQGDDIRQTLQKEERTSLISAAGMMVFSSDFGGNFTSSRLRSPFDRAMRLRHRGQTVAVTVRDQGQRRIQLSLGDNTHEVQLLSRHPESLVLQVDGVRLSGQAYRTPSGRWHVRVGAVELWLEDASFEPSSQSGKGSIATELRAPFNGKVIRLAVSPGQTVARGETLVTLESMKLEHALVAASDGVVKAVGVELGQQVGTGQVLLSFELTAA